MFCIKAHIYIQKLFVITFYTTYISSIMQKNGSTLTDYTEMQHFTASVALVACTGRVLCVKVVIIEGGCLTIKCRNQLMRV